MFHTGNFGSFAGLKASVESALQAEGWSIGDGVLEKSGMYAKLTATATQLLLTAGTGRTGADLTGSPAQGVKLLDYTANPMSFPGTYDLHVFDSEVYLVINYNADRYQQLSWGRSDVQQIGGTGMWFSGSFPGAAPVSTPGLVYLDASSSSVGAGWGGQAVGLFFESTTSPQGCSYVHTGLDSVQWRVIGPSDGALLGSGSPFAGLLQALPSAFNQNTVLLPLRATQRRLSNGLTVVADLANARLCRNDNQLAGEIVTYGTDRWKVYPFHRKNADARNGVAWSTGANHSGTFAYALRYTGP